MKERGVFSKWRSSFKQEVISIHGAYFKRGGGRGRRLVREYLKYKHTLMFGVNLCISAVQRGTLCVKWLAYMNVEFVFRGVFQFICCVIAS